MSERLSIPATAIALWCGPDGEAEAEASIREYVENMLHDAEDRAKRLRRDLAPLSYVTGRGYVAHPNEREIQAACDRLVKFYRGLWGKLDATGSSRSLDHVRACSAIRAEAHAAVLLARSSPSSPWLRRIAGELLRTARGIGAGLGWPQKHEVALPTARALPPRPPRRRQRFPPTPPSTPTR